MALSIRQDEVEIKGKVQELLPLLDPFSAGIWSVFVEPDPAQVGLLKNRHGVQNLLGRIACLIHLQADLDINMAMMRLPGQRVRLVGTWCDDDVALAIQTFIRPILSIVVEHEISVYDISSWPVAVRDADLYVFSEDPPVPLLEVPPPHAGESRTATIRIPFPKKPTSMAKAFSRAYKRTRIGLVAQNLSSHEELPNGEFVRETKIVTGEPTTGQGFYFEQIGLTFEENYLADLCALGTCAHSGAGCSYVGENRYTRVPPHVPVGQRQVTWLCRLETARAS